MAGLGGLALWLDAVMWLDSATSTPLRTDPGDNDGTVVAAGEEPLIVDLAESY